MDLDNMQGSTLQAMAEAVEDADIVLVCFSQKYKNSPNCRAGEYCLTHSPENMMRCINMPMRFL